MTTKVVLRRSAREEILWNFHVVLDSVGEGEAGQADFVEQMLSRFGVPQEKLAWLVGQVCEALPHDLHGVDMTELMSAFERTVPIEWDDDLSAVGAHASADFERSVLGILTVRTPAELPKEVTTQILRELARVVGALDEKLVARAAEAIEELLVQELWRTKDDAARARLKDRLFYALKTTARLEFAPKPHRD
jgi:hypothetical protein